MTVIKEFGNNLVPGKFRNFTLNLKPGLNEFVHENEYGKALSPTFIMFIAVMVLQNHL